MLLLLFLVLAARALYLARVETRAAINAMHDLLPVPRLMPALARTPPSSFLQTLEYAWRNAGTSGWRSLRRFVFRMHVLLMCAAGCAGGTASADTHVRTTLNVLADVIDPAYELAMQGCILRQDQEMREGESGKQSATQTEDALAVIIARCYQVRDAFELMRARHDEARALVEAGKLEQAQKQLEEIRGAWRSLRGEVLP